MSVPVMEHDICNSLLFPEQCVWIEENTKAVPVQKCKTFPNISSLKLGRVEIHNQISKQPQSKYGGQRDRGKKNNLIKSGDKLSSLYVSRQRMRWMEFYLQ